MFFFGKVKFNALYFPMLFILFKFCWIRLTMPWMASCQVKAGCSCHFFGRLYKVKMEGISPPLDPNNPWKSEGFKTPKIWVGFNPPKKMVVSSHGRVCVLFPCLDVQICFLQNFRSEALQTLVATNGTCLLYAAQGIWPCGATGGA